MTLSFVRFTNTAPIYFAKFINFTRKLLVKLQIVSVYSLILLLLVLYEISLGKHEIVSAHFSRNAFNKARSITA